MNYAELVELYFERSTALQNYWTLYVVIIGGLLAFSSMRQIPNRLTTILVTILFLCFAYKNCGAIMDVTEQRLKVLEASRGVVPTSEMFEAVKNARRFIEPSMMLGTDVAGVKKFHYFCDGLTVLTLWSMEWRRRRRERELKAKTN